MQYTIFGTCALIVTLAWLGPSLDDHSAEFEVADQIAAAERAKARFEQAAQTICGENAGWILIDANAIQCVTKRGAKTREEKLL